MTRNTVLLALAGLLAIGLALPDAAGAQTRSGIGGMATDTGGGGGGGGADDTRGDGGDDGRDGNDDRGNGGGGSASGGASGPADYSDGSREVIYVRGSWSCPPVSTDESGSGICGLGLAGQERICHAAGGGAGTGADGGFTCTIE